MGKWATNPQNVPRCPKINLDETSYRDQFEGGESENETPEP